MRNFMYRYHLEMLGRNTRSLLGDDHHTCGTSGRKSIQKLFKVLNVQMWRVLWSFSRLHASH